jgi:hypothetical protein
VNHWPDSLDSLVQGPSPAVLTTYRKDGSVLASPVWYRFHDNAFEVVVAEDDVKLRHLAARPECSLVVFEAVPPFRGVRVEGTPALLTALPAAAPAKSSSSPWQQPTTKVKLSRCRAASLRPVHGAPPAGRSTPRLPSLRAITKQGGPVPKAHHRASGPYCRGTRRHDPGTAAGGLRRQGRDRPRAAARRLLGAAHGARGEALVKQRDTEQGAGRGVPHAS